MKSTKQNTIRQSINRHRMTLIHGVKTTIHNYSLVLNRERAVQTTAIKRIHLARHRLLIKLDPVHILRFQIILYIA